MKFRFINNIKISIILNDFEKHLNSNVTCLMTNKGFQYLVLKIKDKYISIINTHLQSSFNRCNFQYQKTFIHQMNIIKRYLLRYYVKEYLIIGDFNLRENI